MTPRGAALVAVAIAASVLVAVFATRVYVGAALVVSVALAVMLGVAAWMEPAGDAQISTRTELRMELRRARTPLGVVVLGLLWPGLALAGLILAVEMTIDRRRKEKRS